MKKGGGDSSLSNKTCCLLIGYYRGVIVPGIMKGDFSSSMSESDVSSFEHSRCMQLVGKEVCIVYCT